MVGGSITTAHHQEQQQLVADEPSDVAPPAASLPCTPRASPAPLRRSITFTPDKADQKIPPPPTPTPSPPPPPPQPSQNHRYPIFSLSLRDSNPSHHGTNKVSMLCSVGRSPTEIRSLGSKRRCLNSALSTAPSSAVSSSSVATLNNVST